MMKDKTYHFNGCEVSSIKKPFFVNISLFEIFRQKSISAIKRVAERERERERGRLNLPRGEFTITNNEMQT